MFIGGDDDNVGVHGENLFIGYVRPAVTLQDVTGILAADRTNQGGLIHILGSGGQISAVVAHIDNGLFAVVQVGGGGLYLGQDFIIAGDELAGSFLAAGEIGDELNHIHQSFVALRI